MAQGGRKPEPRQMRAIKGKKVDSIPNPKGAIPSEPPEWALAIIGDRGLDFWREYTPILNDLGITATIDTPKWVVLCATFSKWCDDPGDYKQTNPLRGLLSEFGMDPSSRSKLNITAAPPSAVEELLRRASL